jgi:hypothetical protein
MEERPIHEQCVQHPFQCQKIAEVRDDHRLLVTAIGERVKTKTMLALHAIFTTIFLALFGFSVRISNEGHENVERIQRAQQVMTTDVRLLQVAVDDVRGDMKEVKETVNDLRENGIQQRRSGRIYK